MKQRVSLEGLLCKDKSLADKIIFINDQWIKVALQAVATLDISRFFRCCAGTLSTDQAGMLVYYEIFNMDTLSDDYIGIDDTILNNCSFFDDTATSDNRIFNRTLDQAAVGNNGRFHFTSIKVLRRSGIICTGVDRPVIIEIICCFLEVD